ncbi:hypothetical protein [Paenibacillus sp. GbtcB18]|uniref:hypothetical protein n=1 Tax=Paenibacillus sp. GbtcB18 TaxID=2824763 RepID=UPI001C2F5048|nr:hypothetical protein [Paenibacillus sp. GbtcB18]
MLIELGYALNVNEGFRFWLQIAQNGAQSESVPKWDELNKLKQASLSKFSFKYTIINGRLSVLEAYRIQVNEAIPNMNCPNRTLKQKSRYNEAKKRDVG